VREPQPREKKKNRALQSAMKSFWGLGVKLASLDDPEFRMLGVNLLTQMLPDHDPNAGRPRLNARVTQGIHRPIEGELLDRYERNLNGPQLGMADFLMHFNKNRQDTMPGLNVTGSGLRQLLANVNPRPANPSPGFEYRPNPTLPAKYSPRKRRSRNVST
jgi:hypothetical protein